MIPALKSEFRKLFTVRSTYVIFILALLLIALFAFYFEGYKGNTGSPASQLAPTAVQEIVINTAGTTVIFVAIIAVLFMAHEYRYNIITYTLTANVRRTKALLAKAIAISVFGAGFGLAAVAFGIGAYYAGLTLRDASLPAQEFDALYWFGKTVFYFVAYALIGLLIATLLRSIVGAIAALFVFPVTVEPLLGILLKENAAYLPFSALDNLLRAGQAITQGSLSSGTAALVTIGYLAVGWLITWLLFLRRDAV